MTPEEVREIVREEIRQWELDRAAASRAWADQHRAQWNEINADSPEDGQMVRELKRIMRGEDKA